MRVKNAKRQAQNSKASVQQGRGEKENQKAKGKSGEPYVKNAAAGLSPAAVVK
jgi:hypothetical protein